MSRVIQMIIIRGDFNGRLTDPILFCLDKEIRVMPTANGQLLSWSNSRYFSKIGDQAKREILVYYGII